MILCRKLSKKKQKKRRTYNYSYNYLNSISGKSIDQGEKVETRRENKWQMMKSQENPATASSRKSTRMSSSRKNTLNDENGLPTEEGQVGLEGENKEIISSEQKEGEFKGKKVMEEEDESSKDYHYLISVTLTRDPDNVGLKNAGPDYMVISHYDRMNKHYELYGEEAPMDLHVGEEYQAKLPELELSNNRIEPSNKKRRSELIWNPKSVDEVDIDKYLKDLAKLLNCEHINQEKALKLLKRKNYKKDKVKVNISKNEKFYSSFLVVSDVKNVSNEHLTEYTNL